MLRDRMGVTMLQQMFRWAVVVVTLAFFGTAHAEVEKRVALIVGVSQYKNVGTLPNPSNDARLIAATLSKLNFQVQTVIDPDYDALKKAVQEFGRRLDGATVALFYYAGHGIEVSGKNYLLPTNAALSREQDLRYEALEVDAVLDEMNGPGRISLVFLDACRNNPLTRSLASHMGSRAAAVGQQGLKAYDRPGATGTLIAFATAPGSVAADGQGQNSPFAAALAKHMVTPGLDVIKVIQHVRVDVLQQSKGDQLPWSTDSLTSDFAFVPKAAEPSAPVVVPGGSGASAEIVYWQSIAASTSTVEFEAYLQQFPQGIYAGLARARLASLTTKPSPAPEAAEPELTQAERQAVQAGLTVLGFYRGTTDLPSAIRQWQAYSGLTETGRLTGSQKDRLLDHARRMTALLDVAPKSPRGMAADGVKGGEVRFNRGRDFEQGESQPKDLAEAAYWYALAANDGWAPAFTNLGTLYGRGMGVGKADLEAAQRLYVTAAALGEGTAMFNLGVLAEKGMGMTADRALAKGWYARGAERRNAASGAALQRLGG
jgi:hypothetical protein